MKIGVLAKDLRGPLENSLHWIAKNGFSGVQVWKQQVDAEGIGPESFRKLINRCDLEVSAIGGGPNLVDPNCAEESLAAFRGFIEFADALGVSIVTCESKCKPEGLSDEKAWDITKSNFTKLCEYALRYGVAIAVEPSASCFIRDHRLWLELKERIGASNLKVNYDPANIAWAREDPVAVLSELGEYIVHTHAKDLRSYREDTLEEREEEYDVVVGSGIVDYPTYLRRLHEIDYEGYLGIEMHAGIDSRLEDILESKRFLEDQIAQINNI